MKPEFMLGRPSALKIFRTNFAQGRSDGILFGRRRFLNVTLKYTKNF